jgi:hypothetical protein
MWDVAHIADQLNPMRNVFHIQQNNFRCPLNSYELRESSLPKKFFRISSSRLLRDFESQSFEFRSLSCFANNESLLSSSHFLKDLKSLGLQERRSLELMKLRTQIILTINSWVPSRMQLSAFLRQMI